MKNPISKLCIVLVLAMFAALSAPVWAHEGEQHGTPAPAAGSIGGPVRLSGQARKNLGLETGMADLRPIETIVKCFGVVEAVPDKVNYISVRSPGQATKVLVNQGDAVKKDDLLAEVESRQIGDPPPTIQVKATMAGTVMERHLFVGEPIEPDKVLFRIADLSTVHVKCHVYEADVGIVALGQKSRFYFEAYPDQSFKGTVELIGGELEEETRSLPVWFRLDNPKLRLRPNMRAEVRIVRGAIPDVLAVPVNAVLGDAGNYFVYVENGDVYERKTVVIGKRDDRYVEITDGLVPGDVVVTQGNYQLQFATSSPGLKTKKEAADVESKEKKKEKK
ncbi:MAG: efflux RND transporter periplasmic adaptor subunit [Chloroflexi bacterium]|nr:efflux RND transporter periplasmic adaptor subunit [Chloroflexota bacterium]